MKKTTSAIIRYSTLATVFALSGSMISINAFADDTITTGGPGSTVPSVTTLKKSSTNWYDNFLITSYSTYNGPNLSNFNKVNGYLDETPDGTGQSILQLPQGTQDLSNQYLDTAVTIGYNLDDRHYIAFVPRFSYFPVGNQDITRTETYFKIADRKFLHSGSFNSSWDFRVYIPTGNNDHNIQFLVGFKTVQFTTWDIPKTRFTVGAATTLRGNIFDQYDGTFGPTADQYLWKFTISPFVNYQAWPTVALTLWTDVVQLYQAKTWGGPHNDFVDIEPGFSWDITPKININPYVNLFPQTFTSTTGTFWSSASINFNLSVKYL